MVVEYVGTRFHGSSGLDTRHITVQLALTAALEKVTHASPIHVVFAGRTDADVHALGQVAHISLPPTGPSTAIAPFTAARLRFLVNQALYHAGHHRRLHVRSLSRVSPSFHARFSAVARVYVYRVILAVSSLFEYGRAWQLPCALDIDAMRHAAALLVGTHDFTTLVSHRPSDGRSTVRTLSSIAISARQVGDGMTTVVEFEFTAPSFLHHQVRNVVAILAEVGRGRLRPDNVGRLLCGVPRRWNPIAPAPGWGLFLKEVRYDAEHMRHCTIEEEDGWESHQSLNLNDGKAAASEDAGHRATEADALKASVGSTERRRGRMADFTWQAADGPPDGRGFLWRRSVRRPPQGI